MVRDVLLKRETARGIAIIIPAITITLITAITGTAAKMAITAISAIITGMQATAAITITAGLMAITEISTINAMIIKVPEHLLQYSQPGDMNRPLRGPWVITTGPEGPRIIITRDQDHSLLQGLHRREIAKVQPTPTGAFRAGLIMLLQEVQHPRAADQQPATAEAPHRTGAHQQDQNPPHQNPPRQSPPLRDHPQAPPQMTGTEAEGK
jgi:hypothetical protein